MSRWWHNHKQCLITGTDGSEDIIGIDITGFQRFVYATGDVGALAMHIYKNNELQRIVSDLGKSLTDHQADVDFLGAGDLAAHKDFPFVAMTSQATRE